MALDERFVKLAPKSQPNASTIVGSEAKDLELVPIQTYTFVFGKDTTQTWCAAASVELTDDVLATVSSPNWLSDTHISWAIR